MEAFRIAACTVDDDVGSRAEDKETQLFCKTIVLYDYSLLEVRLGSWTIVGCEKDRRGV